MNFVSKLTSLPNLLMNNFSSVFLASGEVTASFLESDNFLTRLLRVVLQFFYFATKWLMYMIDVIYFYVLQLVGVGSDTTIFDSSRTDPTFRMLIDNKDEVTTYIKNFAAIAIILIIVTAIIAIIKLQAQAMRDSKTKKTPTSDVLKSMFKSVLLIILTPLIAILGIIASSVILQGLYRATNLSDSKSLGGRIFNASASAANKYKAYADKGVRIPIRYCFTGDDKADAIVYASNMVAKNSFPSLDYFNDNNNFSGDFYDPVFTDKLVDRGSHKNGAEAWLNGTYYKYFDRSDNYKASGDKEKHMIMKTHANEYYAMSDVIGYALDTMEPYYFVTIQELVESISDVNILKTLVEGYKIRPLNDSGSPVSNDPTTAANALKNGGYTYIEYTSRYADGEHTYIHIKDAIDEMEGAKFTIAYKKENPATTFTDSIYGDYVLDGTYKPIEKFFYKENSSSRYKVVDLYYKFNPDLDRFEKVTTYNASDELYYRIGEDYKLINDDNKGKFYYKIVDGDYKNFTLGANFKSATKDEYFLPLVVGVEVGNSAKFSSQYISPSNIITARGVFDESSYPTAIRRMNNGNIMFYRDDLELVTEGSVSSVGKLEEIEAEEDTEENEEGGVLSKIGGAIKSAWNSVKTFVSSLFNPLKMVPDLAIDESKMSSTYTNKTKCVAQLEDGKMHISYFFGDSITSKLTRNMYSFNLNHLFEPMNINYIVLVVGSVVLFKVILTAVFGVINRSLSLFMMILIYPLACATIPLDEASGTAKTGSYYRWSEKYTKLLFSTFGLLLSINFVFIIIPVIDTLVFFTPENLQSNLALARIASALYNPLHILGLDQLLSAIGFKIKIVEPNYHLISAFINKILRMVFQIAAFSLMSSTNGKGGGGETFYSVIQGIVKPGGEGVLEDSPMDAVKKTLKTMATTFNIIFFPHKAVLNVLEKSMEEMKKVAKDAIPGSAILEDAGRKAQALGLKIDQDEARKALISVLKSGGSQSDVEDKLGKFKSTHDVK
jgi:hypothetical protein